MFHSRKAVLTGILLFLLLPAVSALTVGYNWQKPVVQQEVQSGGTTNNYYNITNNYINETNNITYYLNSTFNQSYQELIDQNASLWDEARNKNNASYLTIASAYSAFYNKTANIVTGTYNITSSWIFGNLKIKGAKGAEINGDRPSPTIINASDGGDADTPLQAGWGSDLYVVGGSAGLLDSSQIGDFGGDVYILGGFGDTRGNVYLNKDGGNVYYGASKLQDLYSEKKWGYNYSLLDRAYFDAQMKLNGSYTWLPNFTAYKDLWVNYSNIFFHNSTKLSYLNITGITSATDCGGTDKVTDVTMTNGVITTTCAADQDSIPSGMIAPFYLMTCPAGWVVTDGTGGTPDLRNRFIVANGTTYAFNTTGGSASYTPAGTESAHLHSYTQVPNHVHVQAAHSATTGALVGYGVDASTSTSVTSGYSTANPTGGVATAISATNSSSFTGTPATINPPYYSILYCMKT